MINGISSRAASLMTIGEVCDALRTDTESGLSSAEVLRRQKFFGLNEFEVGDHESLWKKYLDQVLELMDLFLTRVILSFALICCSLKIH